MTVMYDLQNRSAAGMMPSSCLEEKFEVLKDIGDGSFGSVVLARVRSAGAHVARRGTVVSSILVVKSFVITHTFLGCD